MKEIVIFLVTIVIVFLFGMMLASGSALSPQAQANAQLTLTAGQGEQMVAAQNAELRAQATQTGMALVYTMSVAAATYTAHETQTAAVRTSIAVSSSIYATQTAEPYNAALVATRANTEQSNQLAGSAGLWGMLAILGLIGLAFFQMLRTRAGMIPRAANGQLPAVRIGNTVFNPGQELGPVTVHNPGVGVQFVWNAYVLWCMIRRQKPEMSWQPRATIETTNANATADHLLAAHQATQLPQTMAAMFQPIWRGWLGRGDPARERQERVQLAQQASGLLLTPITASAPSGQVPQIVAGNESQAHEIAQALGHDLTGIVQGEVRYLPQPSPNEDSSNDEKDA